MKKIIITCLTALTTFALTGCSFFENLFGIDNGEIVVETPVYEDYQSGFNYVSKRTLAVEEVPVEARDFTLEKSEDYDVTYEKVKATGSYEDMCSMGVNNDILYPGALVDTTNGAYKPITIKRAPITLSTNLESVLEKDAPISTVIESPSLSSVRQGIREIVSNNITKTTDLPANMSYSIREITSESEFKLNIGFGLQVSKFDLKENFGYSKLNKQTNLVYVLKQVYYTIDMDTPTEKNSRDLFHSSLKSSEINDALKGTIPAYVNSVSYGRIAFISIQTNYSKQEITNALAASWGKMSDSPGSTTTKKLSMSLDTTLSQISSDTETSVDCYVYGGNGGQTVSIGSDAEGTLMNIFSTFNGGGDGALPISYTMRHLDGSLAKIQDVSEYTIKHVTYNPKKLMDWSFLDALIKNGTLFNNNSITLDFSAMIDYSNPKEAETNAKRTITIPDNVKDLTIIGPNKGSENIVFNELTIKVDYRNPNNPLTIHLDSISFNADPDDGKGICISAPYDAVLTIDVLRRVILTSYGGAPVIECRNLLIKGSGELSCFGSDSVTSSTNTYPCIDVLDSLTIDMTGSIYAKGSNGLIDGETKSLASGRPALKCKNLSFNSSSISHLFGGDGVQPKTPGKAIGRNITGATGIEGGDGGSAIEANIINILSDNLHLHAGNGGQGGQGGQGSDGVSEWDTGVDGGTGGKGAKGGDGGIPFKGEIVNQQSRVIYLYGGNGGIGGTGGTGGQGGISDGGGVLIIDNSRHKGLNGGQGGTGGQGGSSSKAFFKEFKSSFCEIQNLDSLVPGLGGDGGEGGAKGYIYNHSWDHGTYYGSDGAKGALGQAGIE